MKRDELEGGIVEKNFVALGQHMQQPLGLTETSSALYRPVACGLALQMLSRSLPRFCRALSADTPFPRSFICAPYRQIHNATTVEDSPPSSNAPTNSTPNSVSMTHPLDPSNSAASTTSSQPPPPPPNADGRQSEISGLPIRSYMADPSFTMPTYTAPPFHTHAFFRALEKTFPEETARSLMRATRALLVDRIGRVRREGLTIKDLDNVSLRFQSLGWCL